MAIAEYIDREQVLETLDYWEREFSEIDHYIWRIKDDIKQLPAIDGISGAYKIFGVNNICEVK